MEESHAYYRCYAGSGLHRDLLCKDCGEKGPTGAAGMILICEACVSEREETGERLGEWGVPGFARRDAGLRLLSTPVLLSSDPGRIVSLVSMSHARGGCWLALTAKHELLGIDTVAGQVRSVCQVSDLGLPVDCELWLRASRRGDFAVVAEARGSLAKVIDLATGRVAMELNRGDYHEEQCIFSAAFFEHEGRTLLVHATAWNRLDISDPRTGELLTARGPVVWQDKAQPPAHCLDYFHCGLLVSPGESWIVDNGWVWQPWGVIRTWNLQNWVAQNVWESEDGPSVRDDVSRGFWDGPLCWVGEHRLAIWGIGDDDRSFLPGIGFIDVISGDAVGPMIGPFGPGEPAASLEAARKQRKSFERGVMEFDRYLFAWSPSAGFSAWDIADGARVFWAEDFSPLAYNAGAQEFFSQGSDGRCYISKLNSG